LTPPPKNVFSYQEDTLLVKLHDSLQHSSLESIHMLEKLVLPNIILHMTQKGYLNFIKDLNDNGIDINQSDFEGRNSYHIAARENNLNMIRYLLEKSVSFIFIFLIFFC
jgi:ankyrin repeat protein